MNNEIKGLIFDIQGYSVHDGPGCRTICFLSGCPLKCEWCANPESWSLNRSIMLIKSKCQTANECLRCIEACPYKAISIDDKNDLVVERKFCNKCESFECTKTCYNEAIKICGKHYTIDDLMKVLNRDREYWGKSGGVTFSGGEPFVQKDFLIKALKKCKESYMYTAIETTAYTNKEAFLEAMKYVDFAFVDIKHMDRDKHKEKTGVYNENILENITALATSNWSGRLVLRMPVIRGYNDQDENIIKIADFMKGVGLVEINILPFHRMGSSKWLQLDKTYMYATEEATEMEKLEYIQDLFIGEGIACYIGSETLF